MARQPMRWLLAGTLILLPHALSTPASACAGLVRITFLEGSPDSFDVDVLQGNIVRLSSLTIDLNPSSGRAYIDTAYGPAKSNAPGVQVDTAENFTGGSRNWTLTFKRFQPGAKFRLLVDLDDTSTTSGDFDMDRLNGGEMRGAMAHAQIVDLDGNTRKLSGAFDREGRATLGNRACS